MSSTSLETCSTFLNGLIDYFNARYKITFLAQDWANSPKTGLHTMMKLLGFGDIHAFVLSYKIVRKPSRKHKQYDVKLPY